MNPASYSEILRILVVEFLTYPNDLVIEESQGTSSVLVCMHGNLADHPKIIGKHGQNIHALQTIMAYAGLKRGIKVRLSLIPPVKGQEEKPLPSFVDLEWREKKKDDWLKKTLEFVCDQVLSDKVEVVIESKPLASNIHIKFKENHKTKNLPAEFDSALMVLLRAIGMAKGRLINFHGTKNT